MDQLGTFYRTVLDFVYFDACSAKYKCASVESSDIRHMDSIIALNYAKSSASGLAVRVFRIIFLCDNYERSKHTEIIFDTAKVQIKSICNISENSFVVTWYGKFITISDASNRKDCHIIYLYVGLVC
jgi:hypothetical protein